MVGKRAHGAGEKAEEEQEEEPAEDDGCQQTLALANRFLEEFSRGTYDNQRGRSLQRLQREWGETIVGTGLRSSTSSR